MRHFVVAPVLITGASGLLGRHTLANWPAAIPFVVASRSKYDLLSPGTFTRAMEEIRPSAVLHLAWCASSTPGFRTHRDNQKWRDATRAAFEACQANSVWMIALGTAVDDETGGNLDAYTAAKQGLRQDLSSAIDTGQLAWLRPFYVVDPDVPSPRLLRDAQAAQEAGQPVRLSSPEARHDFVHAADVGRAIVTALVNGLPGSIDIGSGQLHSVAELVHAVGARWVHTPDSTEMAHSDHPANIAPLSACGWRPTETERLFSR